MQHIEQEAAQITEAAISAMNERIGKALQSIADALKDFGRASKLALDEITSAHEEFRDGMTERAIKRQGDIQALIEQTTGMFSKAIEHFEGPPAPAKLDAEREHRKKTASKPIATIEAPKPELPQITSFTADGYQPPSNAI